MVSKQHKCIFIHILKMAGMSIENSFAKSLGLSFCDEECTSLLLTYNKNPKLGPLSLAHLSPNEYLDYHYVTKEQFETYFRFSIIRNPYDRIISIYKHFQHHRIISFTTFLKYEFPKLEKTKYYSIKSESNYLLDDENDTLVNYVARFEDLPNTIHKILPHLKYSINEIKHKNAFLKKYNFYSRWNIRYALRRLRRKPYLIPFINFNNKTTYKSLEFFTSGSLSFVNHYYSKNFEIFGYKKILSL